MSLRGALAVGVGAAGLSWPGISPSFLVLLFGVTASMDAGRALLAGPMMSRRRQRWAALLEGVAGLVVGGLIFAWQAITVAELLLLIAAWSIFVGVLGVLAAVESSQGIPSEWRMPVGGILSVAIGAFVAFYPLAASVGIVDLIAGYVLLFGLTLPVLGLDLRNRAIPSERFVRAQVSGSHKTRDVLRGDRIPSASTSLRR
jgi:uncharacterized membrane protein HdeD (DUF308 family)